MNRILKCVIIDDEPLARELIRAYVEKTPVLSLEGVFESASDAFPLVSSGVIDLVFLDIDMPMLNGIDFAAIIPRNTRIVYITAYDRYALDGFRVNALDYLLKPVSYPEFMRAVVKASEWFGMAGGQHNAAEDTALTVKADYRLVRMRLDTILYIEVRRDNVIFFRVDSDPVRSGMSMRDLEEQLPSDTFMRVHRSFIVNLKHVEVVERGRIVFGKTYIPIADSRREDFMERIGKN